MLQLQSSSQPIVFNQWFNSVLYRILAPTTYIFFASAIPVISFGEQLERNTGKWMFFRFSLLVFWSYCVLRSSILYRGNSHCCSDSCINCTMWYYPLNYWRATSPHTRCSWANSSDVHIHVQLCKGSRGFGTQTIPTLDRMVSIELHEWFIFY